MPSGRSKGPEKRRRTRRADNAGLTEVDGRRCAGAAKAGSAAKGDGNMDLTDGSPGGCAASASACSARAGAVECAGRHGKSRSSKYASEVMTMRLNEGTQMW
eukprot:1722822-Pleurochrysis_carterae.AAC.1